MKQIKSIMLLLMSVLTLTAMSQTRTEEVNKFDGKVTVSFSGGGLFDNTPNITVVKKQGEEVRAMISFRQPITSSQYVSFSKGSLDELELLKEDGSIYKVDDAYLKDNSYGDGHSSYSRYGNSYSGFAVLYLDKDVVKELLNTKGWRLNGFGEGLTLNEKSLKKFRGTLELFLKEFPEYQP